MGEGNATPQDSAKGAAAAKSAAATQATAETIAGNGKPMARQGAQRGEHGSDAAGLPTDGPTGLVGRFFTRPDVHPYDAVEWEMRSAGVTNEKGEVLFEQHDVEMPKAWSQMATNVVVSKYFHGHVGTSRREHSLKQLIDRVVHTVARWGMEKGYFDTPAQQGVFADELTHLLLHQHASFNSPVWFNCGLHDKPQCSACFINSVTDSMASILDLAKVEGMLFKGGSGAGSNLSPLRGSMEQLHGGGIASGPVSFMRGFDAFAGVIKSGGKTRRAAKMVILNADHPDIVEFIQCKEIEEKKAWALIDAGYDGGFNVPGGAYDSVHFQNANHSVRVTDEFMRAVLDDREWNTVSRTSGQPVWSYKASELMDMIAESTWVCGDPGLQFDTTINSWHTCPNTAPINASNPCSEYMFLDDSACNLASINLMKYRLPEGGFDVPAFRQAVRVLVLAQEIIVSGASYPTERIGMNSEDFRPLGLGFANLGALLMAKGLPYDGEAGRAYAAAITAVLTGEGYQMSADIAAKAGPFAGYAVNREPFLRVIRKHRAAVQGIESQYIPDELMTAAATAWDGALEKGEEFGYRNAQISVLAPTGTIGFMMDCDTTGVEPDIALVKYKKLVGGGLMKIVNQTVPEGLKSLGYSRAQVDAILNYIDQTGTIEGAPGLSSQHLPVFDCAFKPAAGIRTIGPMGHVRMMGAVQPFLSGAISKTVNVPAEATVPQIRDIYIESWRLGVKAIAIYRDGSKRTQPLNTSMDVKKAAPAKPVRRRLPDERKSVTHKFSVGGHEGYITVGMYDDGTPGEIFITMAKQGSTISGLMDSVATGSSIALQYGVPLAALVKKFSHTRFEPAGFTNNPDVPIAKSVIDYIFRWLGHKFLAREVPVEAAEDAVAEEVTARDLAARDVAPSFQSQEDSPPCPECGSMLVRNGACYKCINCGTSVGCS
ncbi:MAG: vitamin B12-dependent ribonucleotide reductase [Nitrospirota bacterium]|nr:vitamin B12-dependent ribonucleotide reductase [Nitrospirota bacterium]